MNGNWTEPSANSRLPAPPQRRQKPQWPGLPTQATDTLGQIEELGWPLEHFASVFVETETNSRGKVLSSGEVTRTSGYVEGIYLVRRTSTS